MPPSPTPTVPEPTLPYPTVLELNLSYPTVPEPTLQDAIASGRIDAARWLLAPDEREWLLSGPPLAPEEVLEARDADGRTPLEAALLQQQRDADGAPRITGPPAAFFFQRRNSCLGARRTTDRIAAFVLRRTNVFFF